MERMLIRAVLSERSLENVVVDKRKAVGDVVQRRAENEPLYRAVHSLAAHSADDPAQVTFGVGSVVTMEEPMTQRASRISKRVDVRLDASEQEHFPAKR